MYSSDLPLRGSTWTSHIGPDGSMWHQLFGGEEVTQSRGTAAQVVGDRLIELLRGQAHQTLAGGCEMLGQMDGDLRDRPELFVLWAWAGFGGAGEAPLQRMWSSLAVQQRQAHRRLDDSAEARECLMRSLWLIIFR